MTDGPSCDYKLCFELYCGIFAATWAKFTSYSLAGLAIIGKLTKICLSWTDAAPLQCTEGMALMFS